VESGSNIKISLSKSSELLSKNIIKRSLKTTSPRKTRFSSSRPSSRVIYFIISFKNPTKEVNTSDGSIFVKSIGSSEKYVYYGSLTNPAISLMRKSLTKTD
jgi:hypothetical protein